jgi:hypothetical protein
MSEHLSALALDEAAAGEALAPEVRAHLDGCAACAQKVQARKEQGAALVASSEGRRRLEAVSATVEAKPARGPAPVHPLVRLAFVASLPIAAALTLFLLSPRTVERLKGGVSVELIDSTGTAATRVVVGQRLQLAAGPAGRSFALVFTVSEGGAVTQVWPEDRRQADPIPPGSRTILIPSLEVTPGSFTVHACFADEAVSAAPVVEALVEAAERAKREGKSPLDAVAAPDDVVCAHQRIEVGK